MRHATLVLFAAAPALFCSAQLLAQNPAGDQGTVLHANAREVVVDVVVTKGNGEPVPSLHKPDFQILEDGKPQTIDFFEEHAARTRPAGSLPQPAPMPPNVYTNVPPAPEDDAVNVLLLDSLNTPPQMISYARKQILGYLDHVKPGTRMAIIALNDKLNFVQGFTADAARLREVALKQSAPGLSPSLVTKAEGGDEQELESFLESNAPSAPGGAPGGGPAAGGNGPSGTGWTNPTTPMSATSAVAGAFSSYQSYKATNRIRMTLEALSDIARYLTNVPGRKNLIWFSGDFPVVVFPKFDQRQDYADNAVALKQVQKTADLLTAARVAVYPVFANGMMSEDIVSADNRSPGSAANPSNMATLAGIGNYAAGHDERASEISAMNQIASDTGGKAVYNTNDLDAAIGRSVSDGSHYYTLVYSPANKKMDGRYRKIEVKLADSKVKLSYRHGYNADEESSLPVDSRKDTDPLRQQLVHGMPNAAQILFAARVTPETPQPPPGAKIAGKNPDLTGPRTRYSIDVMIRWNDIALAAAPDGTHQGKFEIALIAWDSKGKSVNWEEGIQSLALKQDIYSAVQKSGIPEHMEIDLPNTNLYFKLGILDLATGKTGTLEFPLHATAPSPATTGTGPSSAGAAIGVSEGSGAH